MPNTEPKIEEWMRESILEIDSVANPLLSENIAIIAKHYAAHRDERVKELEEALEKIINQQPCCEGGGCFYPMHDGDGNYIGEQNIDPLSVIQEMVQIAGTILAKGAK